MCVLYIDSCTVVMDSLALCVCRERLAKVADIKSNVRDIIQVGLRERRRGTYWWQSVWREREKE